MCGNYIRLKQLMNMIGRQLAVLSPEHSANLMGSACSALNLAENPKKLAVIYQGKATRLATQGNASPIFVLTVWSKNTIRAQS